MTDIAQQLLETVTPYWEAEAEITRRFFAEAPTKEGQVYWLRAQIWKNCIRSTATSTASTRNWSRWPTCSGESTRPSTVITSRS